MIQIKTYTIKYEYCNWAWVVRENGAMMRMFKNEFSAQNYLKKCKQGRKHRVSTREIYGRLEQYECYCMDCNHSIDLCQCFNPASEDNINEEYQQAQYTIA